MNNIAKPIIIVGTGRSGSTIFHQIFTTHPSVTWLSTLCHRYPNKPNWNRFLLYALENPIVSLYLRKKFVPFEAYPFWDRLYQGFSEPFRDLLSTDVTKKSKEKILKNMACLLTRKRPRLLLKITGWPRIGFIDEVFEGVKFIHVVRDGRAVVNSMLEVPWWSGWRGPQNWRWGALTKEHMVLWRKSGQCFAVLAAIEWLMLMDAMEKAKQKIEKERFTEIHYEALCSDPVGIFKKVIEFCELEWNPRFEKELFSFEMRNTNDKWAKNLSKAQQRNIEAVMQPYLSKYGYV